MIHRPKIDHFRLWSIDPYVKENKLWPWLLVMLKNAARYFGLDNEKTIEIGHRCSFADALEMVARNNSLKLMPQEIISRRIAGLPIIARDKKTDWPVLLLPHGYRRLFVLTDVDHKEIITIDEAAHRYDHVTYLLLVNAQYEKNNALSKTGIIMSFLPARVVVIFSLIFLSLFMLFLLVLFWWLFDFGEQNTMVFIFSLVFLAVVLAFVGLCWQTLAIKNVLAALFLLVDDFFKRIFLLPEQEFLSINKSELSRLITEIKESCKKYFFHRLDLFIYAIGIVVVLAMSVVFFGAGVASILAIVCMAMSGCAFFIEHKRRANVIRANTAYDNTMKVLDNFRISLAALNGLKASSSLTHQLMREKEKFSRIILRISSIDFFRKAGLLFLPIFLVVIFTFVNLFLGKFHAPYEKILLVVMLLVIGFFMANYLKTPHLNIDPFVMVRLQFHKWPIVVKTRVEPVQIEGAISLDNVSFAYANNSALIIKNFNLAISAHTFHVLYGPAGVGKSTLIQILMGLVEPDAGQVVIDGQDMRSLNKVSLRRYFGVVSLESKLFAGTVMDNIVCGRDFSMTSLKKLLLSHEIFDCLIDMPMSLNTYVFWHTKNLSRFEKTIILLARALLHQPKILFADDLMLGQSQEYRHLLLNYLAGLTMTRVITSHENINIPEAINVNVNNSLRIAGV